MSPERDVTAQAIALANKIRDMAGGPVNDLKRTFKILGWPMEYRGIVLRELAHQAHEAAVEADEAAKEGGKK